MRRELVIDCSVSAAWFLPDERTELSEQFLWRVMRREVHVVVPELWYYETLNALKSAIMRGRIADATKALDALRRTRVETVSTNEQSRAAILTAAVELGLSAYDATYVHLAESRGIDLVTADHDILRLQPRFPWIRSLEESCQTQ